MNKIIALGPEGTFGHMAAKRAVHLHRMSNNGPLPIGFAPTHTEVLRRAENEGVACIVAVRNSLSNNVPDSLAYMAQMTTDSSLCIVDEMWLPVEQCLLVQCGVKDLGQVTQIASYPQATAQCLRRISELGKQIIPAKSTADAAQMVALDVSGNTAAIGNELAAELYGLTILERGVQDDPENETLFWIFVPKKNAGEGLRMEMAKSIMVCQIEDRIGALGLMTTALGNNGTDIGHVYTYRRKNCLKFVLELRGGEREPEEILKGKITSMVELGRFKVQN